MTEDGLDLSGLTANTDEDNGSGGSSGGGGGGGRRDAITIKGEFGTHQVTPDETCQECGARAVGVIVCKVGSDTDRGSMTGWVPFCTDDAKGFAQSNGNELDDYDWRRFVD